ncbi:dopamine receptor 4-like [Lytechinus variegatus]|uniref:dopamine receptor 4-like n=1 Tax=Lytechinus variegatus TaxID=7654 RepID=UPI001BB24A39|nr:dopamine receptor 4-like [Lytechinus variegatus]
MRHIMWIPGLILLSGISSFEASGRDTFTTFNDSTQGATMFPSTDGNVYQYDHSIPSDSTLSDGTLTLITEMMTTMEAESALIDTMGDRAIGWSWYPVTWSWWTIMQLVSAIAGILGNGLVILVLFQRRKKSRSTDTLVSALAVADFLTSVVILPVPQAATFPSTFLGEFYCRVLSLNGLMWFFVLGSIYTLVAISIERYIAIIYPIYFKRAVTRRRISVAIVLIWVVTILCSIFVYFIFKVDGTSGRCVLNHPIPEGFYISGAFLFVIRLVFPTTTMLVTQVIIARKLYHQSLLFRKDDESTFHTKARRRVVKTMAIVITIYIICWSPSQTAFILFSFGVLPRSFRGTSWYYITNTMGFFNSCLNPIIYAARFKEFRVAVKQMITCQSANRAPIFDQETPSTPGKTDTAQQA